MVHYFKIIAITLIRINYYVHNYFLIEHNGFFLIIEL